VVKILITGASGLLGANAILELAEACEVVGVYHQHAVSASDVRTLSADLSIPGEAERILAGEKPDWVLHCAAAAHVDECERDPDWAFRLNRDMAGFVAKACRMIDAQLIHISTDMVFDGEKGNYREEDPTNPVNVYGQSKLEGERAVIKAYPDACVLRTNIYGWNAREKLSLAEWFLTTIKTKGEAPGFVDMFSTPISVNDLLKFVENLFLIGAHGVFHIGGSECVTKLEFGREIARIYGFDPELIVPVNWREVGLYADRADNLCLDSQKIFDHCGITLPDLRQGLSQWKTLESNGHVQRLKSLANQPGSESVDDG
jgi:dTDP-4-dehydrorhamnose reductase